MDSLFIAEKLIGDKAYDSDKLDDDLLKKHGVEMIAPHRRNRTKPKTQDGRKSSGFSLGCKISGDWLSDMSDMLIISWLSCCLHARLFCFVFFEIGSCHF